MKSALIRLMHDKPLQEITVQDVARASNIARSTFYYYYASVPDLAEKIQQEFINQVNQINSDFFTDPLDDRWYSKPNPYIERTLRLEFEYRDMLTAFLSQRETAKLKGYMAGCIRHHFIAKRMFYDGIDSKQPAVEDFFVEGHIALIKQWLQTETEPDFADMAIKVYTLMFPKK